jgi:hypothetical protein
VSAHQIEGKLPVFRLPLSGNVTRSINPWTWFFNSVGSQVGLVNIELGQSSNPAIEEEVLTDIASYGKRLGRIEDALLVLLAHFRRDRPLTAEEEAAISALRVIVAEIAAVKAKHEPHHERRTRSWMVPVVAPAGSVTVISWPSALGGADRHIAQRKLYAVIAAFDGRVRHGDANASQPR